MNQRIKQVLNQIIEKFNSGDIPEAVAMAIYPTNKVPSSQWSFTNRILMFLSGTNDARGIRQWREVNRWIKKGSKAIYILVPCFVKNPEAEEEILKYFKVSPVFRYEDTEGKELGSQIPELPDFPLIERAEEWGITVKAIPYQSSYYGYYAFREKVICLASPEENVFFHELSHVSHEKIRGYLKSGQDPYQEIVADLAAQALCILVGKKPSETMGNSYRSIAHYAAKANKTVYSACLKVMAETEMVLNLILKGEEHAFRDQTQNTLECNRD